MYKWGEFAKLIGAPYNEWFSTNISKDFIINDDGLHYYDENLDKKMNSNIEQNTYLNDFLSEKIKVMTLRDKEEQNKKKTLRLKDCSSCIFEEDSFMRPNDYPCKTCREIFN